MHGFGSQLPEGILRQWKFRKKHRRKSEKLFEKQVNMSDKGPDGNFEQAKFCEKAPKILLYRFCHPGKYFL